MVAHARVFTRVYQLIRSAYNRVYNVGRGSISARTCQPHWDVRHAIHHHNTSYFTQNLPTKHALYATPDVPMKHQ